MTMHLADISARIDGIQQLGTVVNAMRGIAAARAQQARTHLAAVDNYSTLIAQGIGTALSLMPAHAEAARIPDGRLALIVFAAEQGFAGTFSERVFDFAGADLVASTVFLVGTRGGTVLAERGVTPDWSGALPASVAGIPRLADQIVEMLYARVAKGGITRLDVIFAVSEPGFPPVMQRRALLPLDITRFNDPAAPSAPLLNLPPATLLAGLAADYLHAGICHAALHAFAAENEARMAAMAAARDQITRQLELLHVTERQVRQEEITAEVIELSASSAQTYV